ncbi:MAG: hypothetical protein IPG72_10300 [Ardenticatenales bacterium]|nr:hypothetical protein [Ardenticatenales bacterium]
MLFQKCITLANQYVQAQLATATATLFDAEGAKEIVARLRQLDWIYEHVVDLESKEINDYERTHGALQVDQNVVIVYLSQDVMDDSSVPFTTHEELRVFAEAFYYTAHRLLVILTQNAAGLPHLRRINANGIRRVRNNLLEHANKKGGRPSYTFSVSNASGTRFRPLARAEEPDAYLDEGIHANAKQLCTELENLLMTVV